MDKLTLVIYLGSALITGIIFGLALGSLVLWVAG
jgi:hypothetical protein